MASSQKTIPIILCGKTEAIGRGVVKGLKPDYEGTPHSPASSVQTHLLCVVVQFITGPEAAISEIPTLLQGQLPVSPTSTLGTGNVSVRPKAIVLGGAFVETFEDVKREVEKQMVEIGGSKIAWCMHDASKPHPPIGPEYGKAVLERCRELLGRLRDGGKLDEPKTETYTY